MRKYTKILKEALAGVQCDVCGTNCMSECSMGDPAMAEYATLEGTWGYCSKRDGERYSCDMCEACFERVSAYIDFLKGSRKPS
jgi:hypothetical protein